MKSLKMYGSEIANKDRSQNVSFTKSMTLAMLVNLHFMHLITFPTLSQNFLISDQGSSFIIAGLGMIGVLYSIFMIYQLNALFLNQHQQILGIMSLNGMRMSQMFRYLCQMSFVFFKKAGLIALLLTCITLPIMNSCFNWLLNESLNLFQFRLTAYLACMIAMMILWFFLILQNIGFVYRLDLKSLISKRRAKEQPSIEFPLTKSIAIFFFVISIFMLLYFRPSDIYSILKFTGLGSFGLLMCIESIGVGLLKKLQKRMQLDRIANVVLGSLISLFAGSMGMIAIIIMSDLLFSLLIAFIKNTQDLYIIMMIILVIMMMNTSVLHQNLVMKFKSKEHRSNILTDLGFSPTNIKTIVTTEYRFYFILIYSCSYFFCGVGSGLLLYYGNITLQIFIIIAVLQLIFGLAGYIMIIKAYQKYIGGK